jgi:hypothetical protein
MGAQEDVQTLVSLEKAPAELGGHTASNDGQKRHVVTSSGKPPQREVGE